MEERVRTLFVYDADSMVALDSDELSSAADALVVQTAHSVSEALDRLTTDAFDCVLSTYQLPDEDGVAFLSHIRDFDTDLPFVLYTHSGSEQIASDAISTGVSEYIRNDPDTDQTETVASRLLAVASETPGDSEAKVRELTEATDDVLWLISADWDEVLFVNSAYSRVWGQPEAKLRDDPRAFLEAVHPEDRPRAEKAVNRLRAGESVEIELRVDSTEESQRRVSIQAEPIFDADGNVRRIAGASREVTEQRLRQRRLGEQQQMVQSIFDAIPDVLYTFDTHSTLLRWNDQLEAETGYDADEIEEMIVTDFVPADEVEKIATSFQSIIEDRRSVTVESAFETSDGERVPFEFTGAPLEDADGSLRGVTGVGRNISNRKERERRFEAVFNNTYQFTGIMSPDGTLLEINQTAIEFAGRSRETLVGQKIWDAYWFQSNETAKRTAREAVETARREELFREQISVQGADREAVIDFSVRPVVDDSGNIELLIAEGRDITRLSEREQQLDVTNRFLRHNIRNKLTIIQGHASVIEEADDDQLQSYGNRILMAATDLDGSAEMARNIHDVIEADPTPKRVNLAGQIEKAVSDVGDEYPEANLPVDSPESVTVASLPSLHEALGELLRVVFRDTTISNPTAKVTVTQDESITLEITTVDGGLSSIEQEVLAGEIDLNQIRHPQGLGIWYVYWHVWYSGGRVTIDGNDVRIHFPES
ncbi:PAS domain S-box protein [Haloarchaeobius sp. FL176]|uniref:PAS domain S-box protein n=1 Tax=Haloarchaeobius sp. FL176 TaxID=2967129 RepID=UPI0021499128|nr:PAS domain S-box protein [Haloarchaeobius sp. FL176]